MPQSKEVYLKRQDYSNNTSLIESKGRLYIARLVRHKPVDWRYIGRGELRDAI